jgi:predicted RNA-binding protein with PUA domain
MLLSLCRSSPSLRASYLSSELSLTSFLKVFAANGEKAYSCEVTWSGDVRPCFQFFMEATREAWDSQKLATPEFLRVRSKIW